MSVDPSKTVNLEKAAQFVEEAARNGAQIVALPEFFTCILRTADFLKKQESYPGPTTIALMEMAKQNNVYLIGGTIPITSTEDGSKVSSTCFVFNPDGELVARYSKLHMYDVSLGPGMNITESKVLNPGSHLSTFETDICKVGLGICVDIRYPELSRIYTQQGCKLLVFPCAFCAGKTGPVHLDVLQRARAVDNQVYIMTISPAENEMSPYVPYGHSSVVNPWGEVIATTQEKEDIVYADIDMDFLQEIRRQLPVDRIRRDDLYRTEDLTEKKKHCFPTKATTSRLTGPDGEAVDGGSYLARFELTSGESCSSHLLYKCKRQ